MIETLSQDENMMKAAFGKAEELINAGDLGMALQYFKETWEYENWRAAYGPQNLVGQAYCILFKDKDVKQAQQALDMVTEPQRKNLPEFYKDLLAKTQNEILHLQHEQKPSEEELQLT